MARKFEATIFNHNGSIEEFDRNELRSSLISAGAPESYAANVTERIAKKVKHGTKTQEIRKWVIMELTPLDPTAAETYRT